MTHPVLPADWVSDGETPHHGGQATALYIRDSKGQEGVYRQLKGHITPKARRRFSKEVDILSGSTVQHRSVVRLLDWDTNAERPWYISERGDPFIEWWHSLRDLQPHPENVATKAVDIVRQLASALSTCHEHGVVHRDIKPTNIVVKRGEKEPWPILIDFGLAYEHNSPRLTDSREAVGNRRFSPDPVRSRMEDVVPWLDVFALAQLFIWMLDEQVSDKRSWARPLHWRHAKYDPMLGKETLLAINAFNAACAFESSAPVNGGECVDLLDQLFPNDSHVQSGSHSTNQLAEMRRGRRQGLAVKKLTNAKISEEIESSAGLAETTYLSLREAILAAAGEIGDEGVPVRFSFDNEFRYKLVGATDLLWLHVGPTDVDIQLRVKVKVIPASTPPPSIAQNVQYWRKHHPDDAICFGFAIEGGIVAASNITYLDGRWITIGRTGCLYMHELEAGFGSYGDNDLGGSVSGPGKNSTIQDVAEYAMSVLTDKRYWEYITATSRYS